MISPRDVASVDAQPSSLCRPDETHFDVPDLIPARMLNEFAYCPRLSYLEWVQSEWADNLETDQGTFGHRVVDKPSRGAVPEGGEGQGLRDERQVSASADSKPDHSAAESPCPSTLDAPPSADAPPSPEPPPSIHARSMTLSAPEEGLIAKLDLLELDGNNATPVDYKRGKAPDIPEGAYEPERVQLCAQGLILRENGFHVTEGVLYFIASRQRVVIPFDEELVERTRELVKQMRFTADEGVIPPPLEDSPKCPRCSLVGICMPDELNWLRRAEGSEPGDEGQKTVTKPVASNGQLSFDFDSAPERKTPRQLLPTRDNALPLYLQEHGLSLGKTGEQLAVKKKGTLVQKVRLLDVSQVCLFGSIHITEPALRELITRGVPVCHFSYGGWFYGITTGLVHRNIDLRIRQYAVAASTEESLEFARRFVTGKIRNCRTLLRRHLQSDDRDQLLFQLNDLIRKAERADCVASLLGFEGMAAKSYFGGFAKLLKGGSAFDINGRNRRPPRDPTNALLSFVYALLTKELTVAAQSVGFDPMLGFYHRPRYGRPSLALDVCEEFRPLLADSTVLTLINNGEVTESSFISRAGAIALTTAGRRAVMAAFERRMQSEVTHPLFGYRISYRRILEVQLRLLARTVLKELDEYPSFCTR
ncbi:MAG: CRISPR-associated endonuclease Cas1 [Planctomycetota bacterium]|nr:CRISPR-associated endonuclease Cas1 [Planctomycetota bacterium]MDA1162295.1 CRISPR-associated endonuclease Cas1 [Planctomycetota bacterium]